MQSVGQKLRAARLAQACTLEQVHSSTRISLHTLEAIEADDLSRVSSAFLYRSFVRQIAEYLSLDYVELSSLVQDQASNMPAPLMPGEHTSSVHVPALQIGGRKRRVRWLRPITSFAVAVVACSGLYTVWQNTKFHLPAVLGTAAVPASAQQVSAQQPDAPPAKPAPAPVAALPRAPAQPAGFKIELSATEPAWLSLIADGRISFRGILERAETKVLEGHQTARIRTGNAGAVEVVFNGKAIGALGSRGQVRTVLFTKNDYEVVESSPRVSLVHFSRAVELAQQIPPLFDRMPAAF
jgi:hypothetical protein